MGEFSASVKRNYWIQTWAKLGFVVGGCLYLIIGLLAVLVAYKNRGHIVGPEGAIQRIAEQPYGEILLGVVAVGLFGYALWCFVQALLDTDQDGNDVKGIAVRIGEFCSGLAYVSLGLLAVHRMRGEPLGGNSARHWTAKMLAHGSGPWLIGLAGVTLAGVGLGLVIYAAREGFRRYLRLEEVKGAAREWIIRLGKWGYIALGVVFGLIGWFLVSAAVHSQANRVQGLDGALRSLAQQSYGPWLLGIVAAGLAAYGAFMLVEARYRRLA
jgi:hypothetical protein